MNKRFDPHYLARFKVNLGLIIQAELLPMKSRLILPRFHRHPVKRLFSDPEESYENEQT